MVAADTGELVWETKVGPGGILGGMQWGSANDGKTIYTASSNSNNASRDRIKPFYPNDLQPLYPGYPIGACDPSHGPCAFSGPGFPGGTDNWTLVNPSPDIVPDGKSTYNEGKGLQTTTGFWSALDVATGEILWQRVLPTDSREPIDEFDERQNMPGTLHGSVTLANGVLFGGGTWDGQGLMVGLDAATGKIIWRFNAQFWGTNAGGIEASPAVVNGVVYWGTGASKGGIYSEPFFDLKIGGAEVRGNKVYAFELPTSSGGKKN